MVVYKWCVSGVFLLNGEDIQQFEICNHKKVRKFKDLYLHCSWWGRLESARMCERLSVYASMSARCLLSVYPLDSSSSLSICSTQQQRGLQRKRCIALNTHTPCIHTHHLYFLRDRQICSSANFALLNQQYKISLHNSIRSITRKCMKRYISTHTCRKFSSAESLVLSPSRSSISAGPVNILTSQLPLLHGKHIFFLERSRTTPFSLSCYFQLYCILDKDFAVKLWGSERC